MTFAPGTKVRYKATTEALATINGLEGVVTQTLPYNTTMIRVTKNSDSGQHNHLIGLERSFSTDAFVAVEAAPAEWQVGDRVKVNAPDNSHHGLVGTLTEIGGYFGVGTVKAEIDESCEAFKALKKWNSQLDGRDWYLNTSTLERVEEPKLKEGGAISYKQVERGQRIRVSYESKGVTHSREGIVGTIFKHQNPYGNKLKDNWVINALNDDAGLYGKGQRLNWGSEKTKETITLLENVPEVDEVLERLLESKGGTVIRAFHNPEFLVREPFSDSWKNPANQQEYTSEFVRRNAGDEITFFVEEGN